MGRGIRYGTETGTSALPSYPASSREERETDQGSAIYMYNDLLSTIHAIFHVHAIYKDPLIYMQSTRIL